MTEPNNTLIDLAVPYALHAISDAERADIEARLAQSEDDARVFYDEVRADPRGDGGDLHRHCPGTARSAASPCAGTSELRDPPFGAPVAHRCARCRGGCGRRRGRGGYRHRIAAAAGAVDRPTGVRRARRAHRVGDAARPAAPPPWCSPMNATRVCW